MCSTRPDELSIPGECVARVCLNAIPPLVEFASDAPVGIPEFGDRVLHDDSIVELERAARELGPIFLVLFRVFEPLLHVTGEQLVCNSLVVLFGGWSSCPLAPPKQPLGRAQPVADPRGVSIL